jgi:hypothetical protein
VVFELFLIFFWGGEGVPFWEFGVGIAEKEN